MFVIFKVRLVHVVGVTLDERAHEAQSRTRPSIVSRKIHCPSFHDASPSLCLHRQSDGLQDPPATRS